MPMHRSSIGRFVRPAMGVLATLVWCATARAADEIHWTFTGPNSVSFDWRGTESDLHFGLSSASLDQTAIGATASPTPTSSAGPFWEARLTGLQAATTYYYAVGSGATHSFHTIPAAGSANFKICVEGDIGNATTYSRMGIVQSMISGEHPDFVLMVGDLTYGNILTPANVDGHYNDVMVWSQDAAYMPIWGNHEWDMPTDDLRNYKGRFDLPNAHASPTAPDSAEVSGAQPPYGEDWYWFDYGNTRFIGIPDPYTYGAGGPWSNWNANVTSLMDQAQRNPAIAFIVTFGHRPTYSSGNYSPGDLTLRGYLDALGATYGKYVLDLCGHSHNYERSLPQSHVTHITAGTGGAHLEGTGNVTCLWKGGCPAPSWSAVRAMHHVVLTLRFTPSNIAGHVLCGPPGNGTTNLTDVTCTQGAVFDTFTIWNPAVLAAAPASSRGFGLDAVKPNPTLREFQLSFRLESFGPATIEVVDASGRKVSSREVAGPSPGSHEATIGVSNAPPGVYFVRLRQAGRVATARVTLLAPAAR